MTFAFLTGMCVLVGHCVFRFAPLWQPPVARKLAWVADAVRPERLRFGSNRKRAGANAVRVTGLTKDQAEDLLDWLEVHGYRFRRLLRAATGYVVCFR